MRLRNDKDVESLQEKIAIKAFSKAVKVAKTFVALKWTKKVKALKEQQNANEKELQEAVDNLQEAKNINHLELGTYLASEHFPQFVQCANDSIPCSEQMVKQITSSKQFTQGIDGLADSIAKVVGKKSKGLRKAEASAAAQARKLSKATKPAATGAPKKKKVDHCTGLPPNAQLHQPSYHLICRSQSARQCSWTRSMARKWWCPPRSPSTRRRGPSESD